MATIKFKRGAKATMPTLAQGEPAYTTDEKKVYIGSGTSNIELARADEIPTKTSQLTNDSGFKTTDNNTTYTLTKSGSTITLTGSDGKTTSVTDADTDTVYTHPSTHPASMITGLATVATSGSYNDLSNKPTSMTPTAHNQASSTINAMTGYSKPSSTGAIATTDTLNSAIGKLEKALDGKQASGNYSTTGHKHTKSEITDFPTLATVATSGKYSDLSGKPTIPTKTSQLTNDSGYKTTDNNTTYSISKSGSTITLTGSDGSTTSVTDSDTDTTYSAAGTSLGLVKSGGDVTISSGVITVNDDSHNHTIANVDNLQSSLDGKLGKTTYEYNSELALGSTGKVCIGKFPMYDSNISVEIKSTTSTTYNGTLIIATQNINTTGGGSYTATVYGDANNALTGAIKIQYLSGSNVFSVYINLPSWSKNLLHIQCVALKSAPTDIATTVSEIPSTATIVPTNALTTTYATKTELNSVDIDCGTF